MKSNLQHNASGGAVYSLGLIGATIYFISNDDTFLIGLIGILKVIF